MIEYSINDKLLANDVIGLAQVDPPSLLRRRINWRESTYLFVLNSFYTFALCLFSGNGNSRQDLQLWNFKLYFSPSILPAPKYPLPAPSSPFQAP